MALVLIAILLAIIVYYCCRIEVIEGQQEMNNGLNRANKLSQHLHMQENENYQTDNGPVILDGINASVLS